MILYYLWDAGLLGVRPPAERAMPSPSISVLDLSQNSEITLPFGYIRLRSTGILVQIKGALRQLSREYSWRYVPWGIAILRIVDEGFHDVLVQLERRAQALGIAIDDELGEQLPDIARSILERASDIVDTCPDRWVRGQIISVLTMERYQLERFSTPLLRH